MKNSKITDFYLVKYQINDLHNRIHNLNNVNAFKHPLIVEEADKKIIGESYYIDFENFDKIIERIIDEEKYFILFDDGSFITIAYIFGSNGEIIKHTLIFVGAFNKHIYLRFDYSLFTPKDNKHFASHMHTSLERESIRIPVNKPLSPYLFLFIVLRYYYYDDSNFTNSLCLPKHNDLFKDVDCFIPHVKV